jgi:hypothetical protein
MIGYSPEETARRQAESDRIAGLPPEEQARLWQEQLASIQNPTMREILSRGRDAMGNVTGMSGGGLTPAPGSSPRPHGVFSAPTASERFGTGPMPAPTVSRSPEPIASAPQPDAWTNQGIGYQGGPMPQDPSYGLSTAPQRTGQQPGGFPFWGPYHESGQAGMSSPSGMAGGGLMPGSSSGRADGASGSMYRNMRTLGQLGSAGKVFGL